MKFPLITWNRIVDALNIAAAVKEAEQKAANEAGDKERAKRAYIDCENFRNVIDRINAANFGGQS